MASELRVDRIIPVNGVPTGGGGGIIQVVQTLYTTFYSATAGSEVYTGASVSITPINSSSKILVNFSIAYGVVDAVSSYNAAIQFILRRGTTTSDSELRRIRVGGYANNTTVESYGEINMLYLDSPNTTSQVTYGLFEVNVDGNPTTRINQNSGNSVLTLMEVSG